MPPSPPKPSSSGADEGKWNDAAVAKAAGFIAFSGIALSLIRSLAVKPRYPDSPPPTLSPFEETLILAEKPEARMVAGRTIQISKGDTLWGLSQRYGVSVKDIKEANGISGDRIYAGKKLIIP